MLCRFLKYSVLFIRSQTFAAELKVKGVRYVTSTSIYLYGLIQAENLQGWITKPDVLLLDQSRLRALTMGAKI